MASEFARLLKTALARRIAFVVVALALTLAGIGRAEAQGYPTCGNNPLTCSQSEAEQASLLPSEQNAVCFAAYGNDPGFTHASLSSGPTVRNVNENVGEVASFVRCHYNWGGSTAVIDGGWMIKFFRSQPSCPPGSVYLDGQCKTCLSLNSQPGSPALSGVITRPFSERCVAGCKLAMTPKSGWCTILGGVGGGATLCEGVFEYTGDSCSVGPTDPQQPPVIDKSTEPSEQCAPAGAGQTMCINKQGQHCYTASTGKKICWSPGETGQKSDGDTMQRREPGPTSTPPNPPKTKDGDTYNQNGQPITTTTTNGSTTVTTTTTNYTTQNGTDGDNQVPVTGSPTGKDDGKDPTSATGGGDCNTPPIVSGDAALGMVATQAWATRCAVEAGNAASVSGDISNCSAPFTVEGSNANAVKLRAMRAQICGDNQPGWTKGDAPPLEGDSSSDGVEGHTRFGLRFSSDSLDTSDMLGGGTCPSFSLTFYGHTVSTAEFPAWCQALAILRGLILLFGAYTAVRILLGSND